MHASAVTSSTTGLPQADIQAAPLAPALEIASAELPQVKELSKITCSIDRNEIVTQWYHDVDQSIAKMLGDPDVPTWARFAKHASYNAGVQLRNLQEGRQAFDAMHDVLGHAGAAVLFPGPKVMWNVIKVGIRFFREVSDLLRHEGLVGEALIFALSEAGISQHDRDRLARSMGQSNVHSALTRCWVMAKNIGKFFSSLSSTASAMATIHDRLSAANTAIYEFMAPRLGAFLEAHYSGRAPQGELSGVDPRERFLIKALSLYTEAKELGARARALPVDSPERAELLEQRRQAVYRGNLLATYGEQVYRAQPELDPIAAFISRSTQFMRLSFPGTTRHFGASTDGTRDWSKVYDRFGIDHATAPVKPEEVSEHAFPRLYRMQDPRADGTIGHLLTLGSDDPDVARALLTAPARIKPALSHRR